MRGEDILDLVVEGVPIGISRHVRIVLATGRRFPPTPPGSEATQSPALLAHPFHGIDHGFGLAWRPLCGTSSSSNAAGS
jgi:hypothetical protein